MSDKFAICMIFLALIFFLIGTYFSYMACFTTGLTAENYWDATWNSVLHSGICILFGMVANGDLKP